MSVTTTANRISHVSAGGTTFAYDFLVDDADWITVYHNGVLQSSGYSVTGVGNNGGGTVIHGTAVTAGVIVTIIRSISPTQLIAIPGGATKFPSESVETALDKLTMLIQQGTDNQTLGIRWPIATPATVSGELFDPTDSTNWGAALVLNGTGTAIEAHPITGGGDIEVLTTAGDIVYHTGTSVARRGIGAARSKLTVSGVSGLPVWSRPPYFYASDYGVPTSGAGDVVLNLQEILTDIYENGGGTLVLERGVTYPISTSLIVRGSNWAIEGNGATIQALSGGFTGTAAANTSSLIRNYTHGYNNIPSVVTSLTDSNITIRDLNFSYNGEAAAGQGHICIWLRYVDGYLVENCTFDDCGDATGMLACRNGLTNHCTATGFINAAFDHWDGCIDCGVTNCRVESTLADTSQGIQFTGTGSLLENRDTVGCYAIGNKVYGVRNTSSNTASAIIFNANDAGSSVQNCYSLGNYIEDCDLGVVFSGDGINCQSINDTLKNVTYAPLFIQHANSNSPDHCRFINPTLIDCDNISGTALATLSGISPQLRGMKVVNSGSPVYNYLVWCASTTSNAEVDLTSVRTAENGDTGTGRLLDSTSPKTTYLTDITQAWTPVLTFATPGDLSVAYTAQVGEYKVVNGMVKAHFKIQTSTFTHSSASGALRVTGLPYAAATLTNSPWSNCIIFGGLTLTGMGSVAAGLTTGSQIIVFSGSGTGIANTPLTTAHAPSGGTVLLQGFIEYMMAPIA